MSFLPVGFKFKPSDEELVRHYLLNKIMERQLPCLGVVSYCDIYGEKEPWELWNEHYRPGIVDDNDKCIYLFTPIKKATSGGSRVNRRVGKSKGTWHGEDSGKKVEKEDGLVWIKRRFKYENESCKDQEGVWFMQELSVQGVRNDNNLVVCRIAMKNIKRKWSDNNQVQDMHCPVTVGVPPVGEYEGKNGNFVEVFPPIGDAVVDDGNYFQGLPPVDDFEGGDWWNTEY